MKRSIIIGLIMGLMSSYIYADSVRHYEGETPTTYTQANVLLNSYNLKLEAILNKKTLTSTDLAEIHKLTYTLENTLAKMRSDITHTANILETLHKASEYAEGEKAKKVGLQYLDESNKLIINHRPAK